MENLTPDIITNFGFGVVSFFVFISFFWYTLKQIIPELHKLTESISTNNKNTEQLINTIQLHQQTQNQILQATNDRLQKLESQVEKMNDYIGYKKIDK